MAELLFPLQFKRQYSGPIDPDMVFATSATLTSYLSNPLRYAGQIAACLETSAVYVLNTSTSAWSPVGGGTGGVTSHAALTGLSADDHPQYFTSARGDIRYSRTTHTHDIGTLSGAIGYPLAGGIAYGNTTGGLKTDSDVLVNDDYFEGDYNTKWVSVDGGAYSGISSRYRTSASAFGGVIDNSVEALGAQMTIYDNGVNQAFVRFTSESPNLELSPSVNITSGNTYNINGVPHNHDGRYAVSAHTHGIASLSGAVTDGIAFGTSAGGLETNSQIFIASNVDVAGIGVESFNNQESVFLIDNVGDDGNISVVYNRATSAGAMIQVGYLNDGDVEFTLASLTLTSASPNLEINRGINITSGSYNISGIPHNHDGRYASSAHNQAWSTISATPTTLSGYGITDASGSKVSDGNGVLTGMALSIGSPASTFSISSGTYHKIGTTDPVPYAGASNVVITNLATQNSTFIIIDITNNSIVQLTSKWTPSQRRSYIVIGVVVHSNRTTINAVNNLPDVAINSLSQLNDLICNLKNFNIKGNVFSANGANLSIDKSSGEIFKRGVNFQNDSTDPHTIDLAGLITPNVRFRTSTGAESSDTTVFLKNYELATVVTTIPNNRFAIFRVSIFSSNLVRIQYGQAIYNSMSDAIDGIYTESFVTEENIGNNGLLRAFVIVKGDATSMLDTTKVRFITADRWGEMPIGGTGGTTTLQGAYNNSTTPEIVTDSVLGAVSIKRGSASDTDVVFEVVNGTTSASTFLVDGNGNVSATSITIPTMTMGVSAISEVKTAIQMLDKINTDQLTPSGFPSRTTTDFTYTLSARSISIAPTSISYDFYNRGKYFVKSTSSSATHTSAFGQYFVYYNQSGNFVVNAVNTPWEFEDTQVTQLYYNETPATTWWRGPEAILFEERHGVIMDPETHGEFHRKVGTYVVGDGFALNGISAVATGVGGLVDVSYGVDSGIIRDEDIPSSLSALNDNAGVGNQYPIFYKIGNANEWRWYVNHIPMLHNSATNNSLYNLNSGGTWSLQENSINNRYYNMYLFAVPFKSSSSVYNYRYIWVMGQVLYSSLAAAKSESVLSLDTNGFPFVEIAPLWKISMRYSTAYTGVGLATGRTRIEGTQKIIGTSLSITVGGTVSVHNNLAGRSDPDVHPATSITYTPTGSISATNVQDAISTINYNLSAYQTISTSGQFALSGHTHSLSALNGTLPVSMLSATGSATSATVLRGDGTWFSYIFERSSTFNTTTSASYADVTFDPFSYNVPYVLQFFDLGSTTDNMISMQVSNIFNGGFRVYWNAMPAIKTITWNAVG